MPIGREFQIVTLRIFRPAKGIQRTRRERLAVFRKHAGEVTDDLRSEVRIRRSQVHPSAGQGNHGNRGAAEVRRAVVHRFGILIVIENGTVFVPTKTCDGDHSRHKPVAIRPHPLRVNQACRHIQTRSEVFADITLVEEYIFSHSFACQAKRFPIGKGGCGILVLKTALRTPGCLGIVKLEPSNPLVFQPPIGCQHVILKTL